MTPNGNPSTPSGELRPDLLLAQLERARAEFEGAERRARTHLAERGVLDQTQVDLASALARLSGEKPKA